MKKLILLGVLLIQCSSLATEHTVQLNGAMSAGVNGYHVPNDQQYKQVDVAFNLDLTIPLSNDVEGFFQLQGGAGGSYLGFPGPEAVLTDINVAYTPEGQPYSFVFGSFDTPFGQYTNRLTNNADMSANLFVKNPLLYTTFAGAVGTLNTLGIMTNYNHPLFTATLALTNGTAESAQNDDGNFGTVIRLVSKVKGISDFSISYLTANDAGNTDSFNSNVSGWMLDIDKDIFERLALRSYFSSFTYNDKNSSTNDDISSMLLECVYHFETYSLGFRYDSYQRDDQTTVNSDIPVNFLSYSALTSGNVYANFESYSFGYLRPLQKDVELKAETFLESGDSEQKALGSIIYVTFFF
tara:strand:- start:2191 stop:3249 length:1059 start_codon:yes stop_codon:yes gene_type:complete